MLKNNYHNKRYKDIPSSFLDGKKREDKGALNTKLSAKIIFDKGLKKIKERNKNSKIENRRE